MTISTLGYSDIASWWDMWQGAGQLNGVCVRTGKKGKNPAIGESVRSFRSFLYIKVSCFQQLLSFANPCFCLTAVGEKRQLSIEVRAVWPAGSTAGLNGTVVSVSDLNGTVGGNVSTS